MGGGGWKRCIKILKQLGKQSIHIHIPGPWWSTMEDDGEYIYDTV